MKITEIINEDVSQGAAIKNITDILSTELPELYRKLGKMAEQFEYNNGPIGDEAHNNPKKFAFIIGGQKSQWYKAVADTHLKPSLYALAKTLPKGLRSEMSSFTNLSINGGKFSDIDNILVPLIQKIGTVIKSDQLLAAAHAAKSASTEFNRLVQSLWDAPESGYIDEPKAVVPNKSTNIGAQNVAVDKLINDILSRMDKKTAGEIRNAIARSDNKLGALKTEFSKRGLVESRLFI